jgi:hypothetical protein
MTTKYLPPLAINFIWHPSDADDVTPILNIIRKSFTRHKDKPFSRGLNLPLFFFSSQNSDDAPLDHPEEEACSNIIFIFTSVNTIGRNKWRCYVEALPQSSSIHIVPIAIDCNGYGHGGALSPLCQES